MFAKIKIYLLGLIFTFGNIGSINSDSNSLSPDLDDSNEIATVEQSSSGSLKKVVYGACSGIVAVAVYFGYKAYKNRKQKQVRGLLIEENLCRQDLIQKERHDKADLQVRILPTQETLGRQVLAREELQNINVLLKKQVDGLLIEENLLRNKLIKEEQKDSKDLYIRIEENLCRQNLIQEEQRNKEVLQIKDLQQKDDLCRQKLHGEEEQARESLFREKEIKDLPMKESLLRNKLIKKEQKDRKDLYIRIEDQSRQELNEEQEHDRANLQVKILLTQETLGRQVLAREELQNINVLFREEQANCLTEMEKQHRSMIEIDYKKARQTAAALLVIKTLLLRKKKLVEVMHREACKAEKTKGLLLINCKSELVLSADNTTRAKSPCKNITFNDQPITQTFEVADDVVLRPVRSKKQRVALGEDIDKCKNKAQFQMIRCEKKTRQDIEIDEDEIFYNRV